MRQNAVRFCEDGIAVNGEVLQQRDQFSPYSLHQGEGNGMTPAASAAAMLPGFGSVRPFHNAMGWHQLNLS